MFSEAFQIGQTSALYPQNIEDNRLLDHRFFYVQNSPSGSGAKLLRLANSRGKNKQFVSNKLN